MYRFKFLIRLVLFSFLWLPAVCSQNTTGIHVQNTEFDQLLSRVLKFDVPVISVDSLYVKKDDFFILDTRSQEEYQTSHIRNAHFLDYNRPDFKIVEEIAYDQPILVYCSVGYRSEKIGRKLEEMGFSQVYNLYGSILEWINNGYPIIDSNGQPTHSLHTYNKRWSKFVTNPIIHKTW